MSEPSAILEQMLEDLRLGDPEGVEQLLQQYEPFLRLVIRRQLSPAMRSKFDSVDIVQSIWIDVLAGFRDSDWKFADAAHLRAFLVRVAKNRFIDRVRQHQPKLDKQAHGVPLESVADPHATPSHEVQAGELWEQMLAMCTPQQQTVLKLKRDGMTLDKIAETTGMHKSSVRRIIYSVAHRIAQQRQTTADQADRDHG